MTVISKETSNNNTSNSQNNIDPNVDYKKFYDDLVKSAKIPNLDINSVNEQNSEGMFVNRYLNLSDINEQATNCDIITIFTDVLKVDKALSIELKDRRMIIYARRIEIDKKINLNITANYTTTNKTAGIIVLAQEVVGSFALHALLETGSQSYQITSEKLTPGLEMMYRDKVEIGPVGFSAGISIDALSEPEINYCTNEFILGALCINVNPGLALEILKWASSFAQATCNQNDSPLLELFYSGSSLVSLISAQISAAASGTIYVPHISSSVYAKLAKSMAGAISNNEENYEMLFTSSKVSDEFLSTAKTMQAVYAKDEDQDQKLLEQVENEYQNALVAESIAANNFINQKTKVITTGDDLTKIGIPKYKTDKELLAALHIVSSLGEFTAGIGAMVVGQEEAGGAAAEGAVEAKNSVEATAKIAKEVSTFHEIYEKLSEAMKELKDVIELSKQIFELSQSIYEACKGIGKPKNNVNLDNIPSGNDSVNMKASWDTFKLKSDNSLDPLVSKEVDFAADYKQAIDELVIYGKALMDARITVSQACQKVVSATIKKKYAQDNLEKIKTLVKNISKDESSLLTLQQLFYRKYLNSKLSLFFIIKSYRATYYYWALQESGVKFSLENLGCLTSEVKIAVDLTFDDYKKLTSLGDKTEQTINEKVVVSNTPQVLKGIQENGKTQWNLSAQSKFFSKLNRTRIETFRVWLDGEGLYEESDITVNIKLTSSGNYEDKNGDQQYHFNSASLDRTFSYRVNQKSLNADQQLDDGWYAHIEMDGDSSVNKTDNCFFEPTPFSQWNIDLNKQDNSIDFSKITKITFQFIGTSIPN